MPHRILTRDELHTEAGRILAENPHELLVWLQSQGLSPADCLDGPPHVMNQQRSLTKRGVWDAAKLWIDRERDALIKVWKVTGYRKVAKAICLRFVEAKMRTATPVKAQAVLDETELDVLPLNLRWVYLHPCLSCEKGNPSGEALGALYEAQHPAPNQGARNHLIHCQEDSKARQKLFDDIKSFLLEERKKKKEPVGEQDVKEQARVLDMKAELARMQGKASATTA